MNKGDTECVCLYLLDIESMWEHLDVHHLWLVCVFCGVCEKEQREIVRMLCAYMCNVLILHPAGHGRSPKDVFIVMVKHLSPYRAV